MIILENRATAAHLPIGPWHIVIASKPGEAAFAKVKRNIQYQRYLLWARKTAIYFTHFSFRENSFDLAMA